MDSWALGKDKVVWNKDGSKAIFVSSEKLEDYLSQLEQESLTCQANYKNWFVDNPWKGKLICLGVMFLPYLLFLFLGNKLLKFYNRKTRKPIETIDVNGNKIANKADDKLSFVQKIALDLGVAIPIFYGLKKATDFMPANYLLDCLMLDNRNYGIYDEIDKKSEYWGFQKDIWKYGAMITCKNGDKWICIVDSQRGVYDQECEYYAPKLAKNFRDDNNENSVFRNDNYFFNHQSISSVFDKVCSRKKCIAN